MSSRVTRHLMRICAARLDPNTSREEFVELLDTLVEWCVEAGRNESQAAPSVPLLGTADGQARKMHGDPDDEPGAGPPERPEREPRGRGANGQRITFDDRVRIRAEHEAHVEARRAAGYTYAEHGFNEQLIAKYGLRSRSQLKDILRHVGD